MKRFIARRLLILAVIVLLPANALAAALAYVSASALNLRIGPGTNYETITSLPQGTPVAIYGYGSRGRWCDVAVDDLRGWVWCGYLDSGVTGPILTWGPVLGLSLLAYSYDDYYDRYYYDDDGYRYRRHKPDKHHRKYKDTRHRDRDHGVKPDKRDRKRKIVREPDRKRDVKSGKHDRKRKTVRKPGRKRDVEPDKRDRKRKTVRKPDRKRDVKPGKRDRKRKIVRHRDRKRDFKPHRSDRKRKIHRRGGGGGCGSKRRCR